MRYNVKKRILVSGRKVDSLDKDFPMTITSQCPAKWLFVDLETGDVWHVRDNAISQEDHPFWRDVNKKEIKDLAIIVKDLTTRII